MAKAKKDFSSDLDNSLYLPKEKKPLQPLETKPKGKEEDEVKKHCTYYLSKTCKKMIEHIRFEERYKNDSVALETLIRNHFKGKGYQLPD